MTPKPQANNVNEILGENLVTAINESQSLQRTNKVLATAKQQLLAEVLDMITTNQKGTFTDEGGNDCWYIDELVQAAKEGFK